MNIQDTSKDLLSYVSSILEKKNVKEVDEPKAKGEKDFKDLHTKNVKVHTESIEEATDFKLLHLRDLVLHVAEASSDEVLYEDNMELVKKAAGGSAQKIKVNGGKMTMDSFTASTLMAIMKAVKPSVKKSIEDVINSGDKTKILKLVDLAFKSTGRKEDVNEVDEPESKGEKDFKDLHVKDLEVYTEKLDPKADASVWIDDFIKSDAPQFKGKSKEERIEMALAAYYSARREAGLEEATDSDKELASWLRKRLAKDRPGDRDLRKELEKLLKKLEEGADKDVKGDKEAYQKFFQGMLKKFGVKSPAELSGDKEKEFYNAIDAGWKGDDEKKESIEEMKESATTAFYRTTIIHLALRKAGLKPNDAKKVTDALKIIYGGGSEYKGSEVENVVRAVIGDSMGRKLAAKTIEQLHDLSRSVTQKWGFNEAKSGTGYEIYHKDFSTAMQHAYDFAKKKYGITVDPEEIWDNVSMGPRKPSKGKTNSYRLKGDKGTIHVHVYGMDSGNYELTMYKEEVATNDESITEAVRSMDKDARLKIFNDLKKGDKVQIKYDNSIRKGEDYQNFTVTRNKSVVGKDRVEKIILAKDGNPGGVKFFLYNRNGMVSFAIGDMGAVIVDMKKG